MFIGDPVHEGNQSPGITLGNDYSLPHTNQILAERPKTQEEVDGEIVNLKEKLGVMWANPDSDDDQSRVLAQRTTEVLDRIKDLQRNPHQKMYRDLYVHMAQMPGAQFDVMPYLEGLDEETLSYIATQILNDTYFSLDNVRRRTETVSGTLYEDEPSVEDADAAQTKTALKINSLRNAQSILNGLQHISDPKLIDVLTRMGLNLPQISRADSPKFALDMAQIVRSGMTRVDTQDKQARELVIDSAMQEIQTFYEFFEFDDLSDAAKVYTDLIGEHFGFSDFEINALFVKSFALHIESPESVFSSKLNSFIKFCDDRKIPLSEIDSYTTPEGKTEILKYLYMIATGKYSLDAEELSNNVARIIDAVGFDPAQLGKQLAEFPTGFTFGTLIEHYSSGQQGFYFVQNLFSLGIYGNWDYAKDIMPIVESQGPGAFLYISAMKDFYQDKLGVFDDEFDAESQKFLIEAEEQVELVRISKKYGTEATNVLRELVDSQETLTREESDNLDEFLKDIGIASRSLYFRYRTLKQNGDEQGIVDLKREVQRVVSSVASGNLEVDDFHHELFYPANYYVFPPAIGVQKDHYQRLIDRRPERNSDIPPAVEQLQYLEIDLPTGKYCLENGDALDLQMWDDIRETVNQIGKENPPRRIDSISVARRLITQYTENKNPSRIERLRIFEDMYRLHLSDGGMPLPNNFDLTVEGLMQYKEFVGVRLQRDLMRTCLEELRLHDPVGYTQFEKLIQNRIRSDGERNYGVYLSLSREIKRTEGPNREKAIERFSIFLAKFGLTLDSVNGIGKDELRFVFSKGINERSPFDMVVEECGGLIRSTNQGMLQEIEKFNFSPDTNAVEKTRRVEFFISKKQEHGAAGLNMGVCTAVDDDLWEDPDFWNCIILDSSSNRAMGGMHILISGGDLILPGINPSMELLASSGAATVLDEMIAYAHEIRRSLGLSRVIIPTSGSIHSNRDQIGDLIKRNGRKQEKVEYTDPIPFSTTPYKYSIDAGYVVPEKTGSLVRTELTERQKELAESDILHSMGGSFQNRYPQVYQDWLNQDQSAAPLRYEGSSGPSKGGGVEARFSDEIDRTEFLTPIQLAFLVAWEKDQKKKVKENS